jgi:hypothetical protein
MALEAVYLHRCIVVTGTAKMLRAGDCNCCRVGTRNGVATDAFLEAVPLCANTIAHRIVALVFEQVHMIAAHEFGIFDTTIALSHWNVRVGHTARLVVLFHRDCHNRQSGQHKQDNCRHDGGNAVTGH